MEIKKLHDMVAVQASSGEVVKALESAKKKLKIMKTIKQEMILQVSAFSWDREKASRNLKLSLVEISARRLAAFLQNTPKRFQFFTYSF